jgi:hypothetical protein
VPRKGKGGDLAALLIHLHYGLDSPQEHIDPCAASTPRCHRAEGTGFAAPVFL